MKYGICKVISEDYAEYTGLLTTGKKYEILATMGYGGYVVKIENDLGEKLLYPAILFNEGIDL
jgi:hypothetical protein